MLKSLLDFGVKLYYFKVQEKGELKDVITKSLDGEDNQG